MSLGSPNRKRAQRWQAAIIIKPQLYNQRKFHETSTAETHSGLQKAAAHFGVRYSRTASEYFYLFHATQGPKVEYERINFQPTTGTRS